MVTKGDSAVQPSAEELATCLRTTLRDEQWSAGERLGSERQLAEQVGVTRSRLRDALDILVAEGLIRRLIGRSGGIYVFDGTYVTSTIGLRSAAAITIPHYSVRLIAWVILYN